MGTLAMQTTASYLSGARKAARKSILLRGQKEASAGDARRQK
jgi:hypothetical protein